MTQRIWKTTPGASGLVPPERVEPAPPHEHLWVFYPYETPPFWMCSRCRTITEADPRPTEPGAPAPAQGEPECECAGFMTSPCPKCDGKAEAAPAAEPDLAKMQHDVNVRVAAARLLITPTMSTHHTPQMSALYPEPACEATPAPEPDPHSGEPCYAAVERLEAELAQARDEIEALRAVTLKWHALALKHADKFAEAEQLRRERDAWRADAEARHADLYELRKEEMAARAALAKRERAAFMAGVDYGLTAGGWFTPKPDEAYAAWQATSEREP